MARYSDGRSALAHEIAARAAPDALALEAPGFSAIWRWADLRRADDGGGAIVLKRAPDTGERVTLTQSEANDARRAAPHLFTPHALGRERPAFLLSLVAGAGALAALFLVGVPLAAGPLAAIAPARYEARLADLGWAQVETVSTRCDAMSPGQGALEEMFRQLKMHAPRAAHSTVHIVDAGFPNAFTLPGGAIVVTDDLIALAQSPDEVAGVLAHELGHVEAQHVMKNVIRQMGAGLFFDIVFGGAGAGQTVAAMNILTLRFSREDEAEADAIGYRLLESAGLNPGAVAPLFQRLAEEERRETAGLSIPELLSSHPDSARRAAEAAARAQPGRPASLPADAWAALRIACLADPYAAEIPSAPAPSAPGKDAAVEEVVKENGAVGED